MRSGWYVGSMTKTTAWNSLLLACAVAALLSASAAPARSAAPDVNAILTDLGFTKKELARVREGQVVVRSLEQLVGNQLAAVAAVYMEVPLGELRARFGEGQDIPLSPRVRAWAMPRLPIEPEDWKQAAFDPSEMNDVDELFDAKPGLDLNLSTGEFELVARELAGVAPADRVRAASEVYRKILQQRMVAYAEKGLSGIEPYDRGDGKKSSPAEALSVEWEAARELLTTHFPDFVKAVDSYPNDQPAGIINELFWVKENFESKFSKRVAFWLMHETWQVTDEWIVLSARQYFVGHTYSAQQALGLAVPFGDGVIVLNLMGFSSDLIDRYVPMIAVPIGKKIMRSEVTRYFEKVRDHPGK